MTTILSPLSYPLFRFATEQVDALLPETVRQVPVPSVVPGPTWDAFRAPLGSLFPILTPLTSGCNRPLEFTFADQLHSLIYLHVEEYTSGRALLDDLADPQQSPPPGLPTGGIKRSTFFEALHTRGLEQMVEVFSRLSHKAAKLVTHQETDLGPLRVIDGTLIDATLSMAWADYTPTTHKAKVHLCFDLNAGIPRTLRFTTGTGAERPQADHQMEPGDTAIMDRGYQDHQRFDQWCDEGKLFVCRIRGNTQKTLLRELPLPPQSAIFFHAEVTLGDAQHRTRHSLRLIGLRVRRKVLWIVTNRFDLTALQIAFVYQLRWQVETFFSWWKRHLNVYHVIARSPYGLLMQLLAGLITYLLLVIYFSQQYADRPSLSHLRQLRRDIRRERAVTSTTNTSPNRRVIMLGWTQKHGKDWERQTLTIAIF